MIPSVALLSLLIEIYRYVVLAAILSSWIAPGSSHPLVVFLEKVTEPVFAPIRRLLPQTGGFDFSPLVVLVGLHLLARIL